MKSAVEIDERYCLRVLRRLRQLSEQSAASDREKSMPMPKPNSGEGHDEWISRCMANPVMRDEFPKQEQRHAVCQSIWADRNKTHGEQKMDDTLTQVLITKDWTYRKRAYTEGMILDVDEELAEQIVSGGYGKIWDEDAQKKAKEAEEKNRLAAIRIVEDAKEAQEPNSNKSIVISGMRDRAIDDDPMYGFDEFGEFASEVKKGVVTPTAMHKNLVKMAHPDFHAKVSTVAQDSQLGWLIPPDTTNQILEQMMERASVSANTTPVPLTGNRIEIPALNETSRVDGSRSGGIQAYWEGEADTLSATDPSLAKIELNLRKVAVLIVTTDELDEDYSALGAFLTRVSAKELQFKVDDGCYNGTGTGMPLGVLNASNLLVSVAKEAGQATATIVWENIKKMFARMHPQGYAGAQWYINQDTLPELFGLNQSVGTGGNSLFIANAQNSPDMRLLGYPVTIIEHAATVGTVGDIMFANFGFYLLAKKNSGMKAATSIHLHFDTMRTSYRFSMRIDGQPWMRSSITPYKGTNTVGPFVVLATRA